MSADSDISSSRPTADRENREGQNFIREIVERDLREDRYGGRVVTRFPPEPNGYLHIGHAKAIWLNFGIARDYEGVCHLRFDDTNPETEDMEYVRSIQEDVRWLGYDWGDNLFFASDYFEELYEYAESLIKAGHAYVDSQSEEEIREARGSVTRPGRLSPYRGRPREESLDLFRRMRAGEFDEGAHVLRARIDMSSPNMKMRDPLLYRIKYGHHYRRGDAWCIYPMYDFAHPLSDAIENITHSICTLEFENNRPLYDWVVDNCRTPPRPYQYEFNRLILDHTIMSKRKLLQLVERGLVRGWDDPRMPTVAGLRRRGVTPDSIRTFCERIGVDKTNSRVDMALLEYAIRDDLNQKAPRVLCVLDPLRVVIENYPEEGVEWLDAPYWPHDVPNEGSRKVPFSRNILIDRDDFIEDPPPRFHRLAPGREVRLRYGYFITCNDVVRDDAGEIIELRCTYDPETRGGDAPDGRRVRGTLHWVSEEHSLAAEVRLYDRLFTVPDPDTGERDFREFLNPDSEVVVSGARIEPSVQNDPSDERYQFERLGYFWRDPVDSSGPLLVFNRIVPLRDTWAKIQRQQTPLVPDEEPAGPDAHTRREVSPKTSDSDRSALLEEPPPSDAGRSSRRLSPKAQAIADDYSERYAMPSEDAGILARERAARSLFDDAVAAGASPIAAANWIIHEVRPATSPAGISAFRIEGSDVATLVHLMEKDTLSSRTAREVLDRMLRGEGDPDTIVREHGLSQISDEHALSSVIDLVLTEFPERVGAYRAGKTGLLGFFVGQVMQRTHGKANPELAKTLLERRLASR